MKIHSQSRLITTYIDTNGKHIVVPRQRREDPDPNGFLTKGELATYLKTGNIISLVKSVRERTGLSLKEAHDGVEASPGQDPPPRSLPPPNRVLPPLRPKQR